jgi:hypothetical protein
MASAFALNETLTASAWLGGSISGAGAQNTPISLGVGRNQGLWAINVTAASFASGDEFYQFFLFGSNDPAFGNGNCDLLGAYDIAATAALRLTNSKVAGLAALWPGIPAVTPGPTGSTFAIPFSNDRDVFTFQYINMYVAMGGTSPSITFSSWLTPWSGQKM